MALGYEGKLFILAFDHRGSFKKLFGIKGREATAEEFEKLQDAKHLVWEGARKALADGVPEDQVGVLVDEEMGTRVAREAREAGVKLAMPVEKSGQDLFDFEFGEDFTKHIEDFDPAFSKVLVRWNPEDDPEVNRDQGARLKRLGEWLHEHDRKYLFELLVPATESQLALVGGDHYAYDTEVRPYATLRAIEQIVEAGIEPDIWKIEGLVRRAPCELLGDLIRRGGRDGVVAVVLGRGADDARVDHWLEMGAPVDAYRGFAIGRSIWSAGLEGYRDGKMSRDEATAAIAAAFERFIEVYEAAGS